MAVIFFDSTTQKATSVLGTDTVGLLAQCGIILAKHACLDDCQDEFYADQMTLSRSINLQNGSNVRTDFMGHT